MNVALTYFLMTALIINLSPGPAMMFVLQQSQRYGLRAGLLATLGVELGVLIYVFLTALGVSAVFERYPSVYFLIQIIGALYLLYLAYQSWPRSSDNIDSPQSLGNGAFLKGLFINLTNPKIVIFFLSLLPQFVSADSETNNLILYGLIFSLGGVLVNSAVALLSGKVSRLMDNAKWFDYVPPILFLAVSIYSIFGRLIPTLLSGTI